MDRISSDQPPISAAASRGHCNTSVSFSEGDIPWRVCRGRPLRECVALSRSVWVRADMSVPLGKYRRRSPLVFSLVPRCHGDLGSQGALLRLRKLLSPPPCPLPHLRGPRRHRPAAPVASGTTRTTRVEQCRQPAICPPERYEVNIEDRPRGMCRKVGFNELSPWAPSSKGFREGPECGKAMLGWIIVHLSERIIE